MSDNSAVWRPLHCPAGARPSEHDGAWEVNDEPTEQSFKWPPMEMLLVFHNQLCFISAIFPRLHALLAWHEKHLQIGLRDSQNAVAFSAWGHEQGFFGSVVARPGVERQPLGRGSFVAGGLHRGTNPRPVE